MKKLITILFILCATTCFAQTPPYRNADSLVDANTFSLLQYNRVGVHGIYYSSCRLDTLLAYMIRNGGSSGLQWTDTLDRNVDTKYARDSAIAANSQNFATQQALEDSAAAIRGDMGGGSGWLLTGNAVSPTTQFLGSTNDSDVIFKRNNLWGGVLNNTNVAFGISALQFNPSNGNSSAFGANALGQVIAGVSNTAIGVSTLANVINGNFNVAIGYNAGRYGEWTNKLFIDNKDRGDSATQSQQGLIVGTFGNDSSDQNVTINGSLNISNLKAGTLQSGFFTPTVSDSTNVDATSITIDAMYTKIGNIVTVQYHVNVDPNTTATLTNITLDYPASLPANPSAFVAGQGVFAGENTTVTITAVDGTHLKAEFTPTATSLTAASFSVTYQSN